MCTRKCSHSISISRVFTNIPVQYFKEGDTGICGLAVLMSFYCGDAVNKISICGVAVILNPSVCDVCVFHSVVFGEMKLFAVLWFLVWSFSDLNLAC